MPKRLPTELKKIKGTYRECRERDNSQSADVVLKNTSVIIQEEEKISIPRTIKTSYCKKFYKQVIKNLRIMNILSRTDLPQIESMCLYLERMRATQEQLEKTNILDKDNYLYLSKLYDRCSVRFDELAKKFYITPVARVELKANQLNMIKTAQEINKNSDPIKNLLSIRNIGD